MVMSEELRVKTGMLKGHHEVSGTAGSLFLLMEMGGVGWQPALHRLHHISKRECRFRVGEPVSERPGSGVVKTVSSPDRCSGQGRRCH